MKEKFGIIKSVPYFYWNRKGEEKFYLAKPLTIISGTFKSFPVEDEKFSEFIMSMDGDSWSEHHQRVLNSSVALGLFPNLSQPDVIN